MIDGLFLFDGAPYRLMCLVVPPHHGDLISFNGDELVFVVERITWRASEHEVHICEIEIRRDQP